jgi:hypothetical protein
MWYKKFHIVYDLENLDLAINSWIVWIEYKLFNALNLLRHMWKFSKFCALKHPLWFRFESFYVGSCATRKVVIWFVSFFFEFIDDCHWSTNHNLLILGLWNNLKLNGANENHTNRKDNEFWHFLHASSLWHWLITKNTIGLWSIVYGLRVSLNYV